MRRRPRTKYTETQKADIVANAGSNSLEGDPRRVEFGRLHGVSTALQLVPLLGGLALIFWEIKE